MDTLVCIAVLSDLLMILQIFSQNWIFGFLLSISLCSYQFSVFIAFPYFQLLCPFVLDRCPNLCFNILLYSMHLVWGTTSLELW